MPRIKQLRKQKHLGAMELAELAKLDLNQPLMSAAESGKLLFTPDALERVCKALECTPLDLFDNPDEFDLMAVQRRMGGVKLVENKPSANVPFKIMKLRMHHTPNPKRGFRMSDAKWNRLQAVIKWLGYNSLGVYLDALSGELPEKRA